MDKMNLGFSFVLLNVQHSCLPQIFLNMYRWDQILKKIIHYVQFDSLKIIGIYILKFILISLCTRNISSVLIRYLRALWAMWVYEQDQLAALKQYNRSVIYMQCVTQWPHVFTLIYFTKITVYWCNRICTTIFLLSFWIKSMPWRKMVCDRWWLLTDSNTRLMISFLSSDSCWKAMLLNIECCR